MKKARKKGSISKRLGLPENSGPLTKKACLEKVRILRRNLKAEKYRGEALRYAKYYVNWYKWRAENERKAA